MPTDSVRLFIAVPVPPAVRAELQRARRRFERDGAPRLRWVRAEAIHLTLKFLGEVPPARIGAVERELEEICAESRRHALRLRGCGVFGGRRPRVLWAGLDGAVADTATLAGAIDARLAARGFPSERRDFRPHLTLARVPDGATAEDRACLVGLVQRIGALSPLVLPVEQIQLLRSELRPDGARYTPLRAFPLGVAP